MKRPHDSPDANAPSAKAPVGNTAAAPPLNAQASVREAQISMQEAAVREARAEVERDAAALGAAREAAEKAGQAAAALPKGQRRRLKL